MKNIERIPSYCYTAKQYIAELTIYSFASTTANVIFMYYMVAHPGDWLLRYALWCCFVSCVPQIVIALRAAKIFPECRFRLSYAFNWERVFELSAFAFWRTFGGLGVLLKGQGIQVLVNKYFNPSYNASMLIANQVSAHSQTLASSMQGAFAPAITTACGAKRYDEMRALAYRTCKFGMLLALIFILPLALEIRAVLSLWLGNPPPYTTEICWCILLMEIIDRSAAGHMIAVAAMGKIATYQLFLGGSLILTLPLAWVLVYMGFGFVSIGWAMIATMIVCAWGRVWFARKLVGMSARYWLFKILVPISCVVLIAGSVSCLTRFIMPGGFFRICVTTIVCETILLPLTWFFILDTSERDFVLSRIMKVFTNLFKGNSK